MAEEEANVGENPAGDIVTFKIKWGGKDLEVAVETTETVMGLKRVLEIETSVSSKRLKLLGLKTLAGKAATDDSSVSDLKLGGKIMMMGTVESKVEELAAAETVEPHVQVHDDFAEETDAAAPLDLAARPEVQEKLARRVKQALIKQLNPLRPGKKCCVFDIDYTIFALDSKSENPLDLGRPFLHEFFTAIYPHYDLVCWSATSMKWIEMKLRELGVTGHPDYKIALCMDYTSMVTVATPGHSRPVFDCKPLPVLWERYPEVYNPSNTIMLDDLRRNYVLNHANGLVIRPFKRAMTSGRADRELLRLRPYFLKIAKLESFEGLHHSRWQQYAAREIAAVEAEEAAKGAAPG